jgi:putative Ca2+/H+ antiporter (TMEM165/GDT1 family)
MIAITVRTLLLIIMIILLVLLSFIHIYSNDFSQIKQIRFWSEAKTLLNNTNDHSHNKNIDNSATFNFRHAFIASISIIIVSEICDKTFFIAVIMAMHHSLLIIFTGAMIALSAMTLISVLLGSIATKFIPRIYTYYLSSILFIYFGIKMLKDGYNMSSNEGTNEYKEAQDEVEKETTTDGLELGERGDGSADNSIKQKQQKNIVIIIRRCVSPIFIQTFIMIFLAVSIE